MSYFRSNNYSHGFTLIELLVVVSIVSLMSTIVLTSLNSARMKGRNVARLLAIHTFVNAANISQSSGNSLPSTGGNYFCVTATCYGSWAGYAADSTVDAFFAGGLKQKPADPVGGIRGYGGFLYVNPTTINGVTGAFINYLQEIPGNCGNSINTGPAGVYIGCFEYLPP